MKRIKDNLRVTNHTGDIASIQFVQNECVVYENYLTDHSGFEIENIFCNEQDLFVSCRLQQDNSEFFIEKTRIKKGSNCISILRETYKRGAVVRLKVDIDGNKNGLSFCNESSSIAIFRLCKSERNYATEIVVQPFQTRQLDLCSDFYIRVIVNGITVNKRLTDLQAQNIVLSKVVHVGRERILIETQ